MAREPGRAGELDATLNAMVRYVALMSVLLFPFMPEKMGQLWRRVAGERPMPLVDELPLVDVSGWRVSAGDPLFPRPEPAKAMA
jgi:methionyl-tRNA synthetase